MTFNVQKRVKYQFERVIYRTKANALMLELQSSSTKSNQLQVVQSHTKVKSRLILSRHKFSCHSINLNTCTSAAYKTRHWLFMLPKALSNETERLKVYLTSHPSWKQVQFHLIGKPGETVENVKTQRKLYWITYVNNVISKALLGNESFSLLEKSQILLPSCSLPTNNNRGCCYEITGEVSLYTILYLIGSK